MASRATAMTNEAIALTEKKMDMTLDEIIKMSSKSSSKARNPRASNKSGGFLKGSAPQRNAARAQQFIDSRSSIRQGVLAQRRSNFHGNQFPLATEVARKAAVAPIHNNAFTRKRVLNWKKPSSKLYNVYAYWVAPPRVQREVATESAVDGRMRVTPKQRRPQTLDSLFANMKEQRMRALARQQKQGSINQRNARPRQFQGRGAQVPQWGRGGRGASNAAAAAFGNRYSK